MFWESEEARDEQRESAAESFKGMQFTDAPAPALGENKRFAWPACAFDDLRPFGAPHADAEQSGDEGTWIYRVDDDLPGDGIAEVAFRTREGKVGEAYDIFDFLADLKAACPADYTKLRLWVTAADMDPRAAEALN